MRITILAIGSQGDVQPLVALGLGLQRAGHIVRLATHAIFEGFVRGHGLDFACVIGNPQEFLRGRVGQAWQELSYNSFRLMRSDPTFLEELEHGLDDCWRACQDAEAIIYHAALALAGPHIVEKLGLPGFAAAIYPGVRRTRVFAHPFMPPRPYLGGLYNLLTYVITDQIGWYCFKKAINQFRRQSLQLPPCRSLAGSDRDQQNRDISLLYGYSPAVLPRPSDWPAQDQVTGYWFLERPADWTPPPELVAFLEAGPPPVYIGFGSMILRAPAALTQLVLEAVGRSGQRAILGMGWGSLETVDLPVEVFPVGSVPFDWLFPRVAAVVHHGGCGSTAASLRAGIPTVTIPSFADQPFWGQRVAQLRVGPAPIPRKQLTVARLADAIRAATSDVGMRARAADLGARIRAEDGVARAVELIQRDLTRHGDAGVRADTRLVKEPGHAR